MNEFIYNGKSSKDYGLIVNTLPPIVKPPIRTEKIEIDGRNGDIINNLGYMAYDKEITVTRIDGNIDINSIIKWLNYSELGTLVLSNEPSLYYKAQIVEQIDFTRLENFEPVKIKFHVQPFKYKYPIENAILPRGETSGENIKIENGKITKFVIEGKSTQETSDTSPSPEFPSEIQSVSESVEIKNTGKNLFNKYGDFTYGETNYKTSLQPNGTILSTSNYYGWKSAGQLISVKPNTDYVLSGILVSADGTGTNNAIIEILSGTKRLSILAFSINETKPHTFSFSFNSGEHTEIWISLNGENSSSSGTTNTVFDKIQLEKGTQVTEFEEYKESILTFPLAEGQKLYKGSYLAEDGIHHKRKQVILDGTEYATLYTYNEMKGIHIPEIFNENLNRQSGMCNYSSKVGAYYTSNSIWCGVGSKGLFWIAILDLLGLSTVAEFKTWLSEQYAKGTPVIIEYALAKEEIVPYTEEQQEAYNNLQNFELFDGVNNVSNSADTNMIIDYVDNKLTLNNEGNHFSKPIFTITGSVTIEFIVNGNKLFSYTFSDGEDTVIIDSQKQDAYLGTVLKNRNMSGEFPTLEIGENIITWNGNITSIEVLAQSRWL